MDQLTRCIAFIVKKTSANKAALNALACTILVPTGLCIGVAFSHSGFDVSSLYLYALTLLPSGLVMFCEAVVSALAGAIFYQEDVDKQAAEKLTPEEQVEFKRLMAKIEPGMKIQMTSGGSLRKKKAAVEKDGEEKGGEEKGGEEKADAEKTE